MAQTKAVAAPVIKKHPRTLAGEIASPVDDARAQALHLYEAALRLMQEGKYDIAHTKFQQLLAANPGDLADRIRMYINACLTQVAKGKTDFTSQEERYDYAISLLNTGQYEDAREELLTIVADNRSADYAFMDWRCCRAMTGDSHTPCLWSICRGDPAERAQPHSGAVGFGLSGHGGRSALHGAAVSRGMIVARGFPGRREAEWAGRVDPACSQ